MSDVKFIFSVHNFSEAPLHHDTLVPDHRLACPTWGLSYVEVRQGLGVGVRQLIPLHNRLFVLLLVVNLLIGVFSQKLFTRGLQKHNSVRKLLHHQDLSLSDFGVCTRGVFVLKLNEEDLPDQVGHNAGQADYGDLFDQIQAQDLDLLLENELNKGYATEIAEGRCTGEEDPLLAYPVERTGADVEDDHGSTVDFPDCVQPHVAFVNALLDVVGSYTGEGVGQHDVYELEISDVSC